MKLIISIFCFVVKCHTPKSGSPPPLPSPTVTHPPTLSYPHSRGPKAEKGKGVWGTVSDGGRDSATVGGLLSVSFERRRKTTKGRGRERDGIPLPLFHRRFDPPPAETVEEETILIYPVEKKKLYPCSTPDYAIRVWVSFSVLGD